MSDQAGEKTEQPTPRHLEEALKKGQVARSREVQTVFVLMAGLIALKFTGAETWRLMSQSLVSSLSHLHDTPLSLNAMQGYAISGALLLGQCVWPVLAATVLGGLLAGGIQTRFRTTSEVLSFDWERVSPMKGFKRLFSRNAAVSTGIGIVKLTVVIALCFNVTKQVIEGMVERGWGRIINISSVNGQKGAFGQTNYSAAKAGMHGFTKALALEVARKAVTVNTISPGYIGTKMVTAIPQEVLDSKIIPQIPMARLGKPEEVAGLVAYLASDEAAFVTGANIAINGGQHMY